MNKADNGYWLKKIVVKDRCLLFYISFLGDDEERKLYLSNYFEGVYIEIDNNKFNLYSYFINDCIVGEMSADSFIANRTIGKKIWIRNRFDDRYFDFPVVIKDYSIKLSLGSKKYILLSNDNLEFNLIEDNTIEKPIADIKYINIYIENNYIKVCAEVSDRLVSNAVGDDGKRAIFLVWTNESNNKKIYFHKEIICSKYFEYKFSQKDMETIGIINIQGAKYIWSISDINGNEYVLNDYNCDFIRPLSSTVLNYSLRVFKDRRGMICTNLDATLKFRYIRNSDNGKSIFLKLEKKTYDLIVLRFVARKVNTDLEYNMPFTIVKKNKTHELYKVDMEINIEEESLKKGIYQLFIDVDDGIIEERINLKLERNTELNVNTYVASRHPYFTVGNHIYDALLYLDSSNNLKVNIIPKRIKTEIKRTYIDDDKLKIEFESVSDAYFGEVSDVVLVSKEENLNNCISKVHNNSFEIILNNYNLDYTDVLLCPELAFGNENERIALVNNYYYPPKKGRELMRFLFFSQVDGEYKRVWGDYNGSEYFIGISKDLGIARLTDVYYESNNLYIEVFIDFNAFIVNQVNKNVSEVNMFLLDMAIMSKEKMCFERSDDGVFLFSICMDILSRSDYMVYIDMSEGVHSCVHCININNSILLRSLKNKVIAHDNNGKLYILVDELLIFEDEKRIKECDSIIQKARSENTKTRPKVWLIGENYGLSARDNGLAFFEYLMRERESIDAEVYFVTKNENKDFNALEKYLDNVLLYDSDDHIFWDELAELYIVSHGIRDVMPSLYHNDIGNYRKPVIYLQHGITAMKIIDITNNSYGRSIRRFIVSSKHEKQLLFDNRQFCDDEIAVTGFARFDKLRRNQAGKYIWIMPTWREWLISEERKFENSVFFQQYAKILTDKELIEVLRESGYEMIFTLHIEFERYRQLFMKFENDVIHISDMHEKPIANRIESCKMIITDYSSVAFDVAYLDKPVVFFQFDQEQYNKYRGSYINMETDLPGERFCSAEDLIDSVVFEIKNGFKLTEKHYLNIKKYFDYYDNNNSCRIYKAIMDCREEMIDEED